MAFSAGGANVKGVQQIEQGILKISTTTLNPPSVSTNETTITVPSGKKWILKTAQHTSGSLVATVGQVETAIVVGGSACDFQLSNSNSKIITNFSQQVVLLEGQSVRFRTQLTAYTSGTVNYNLLYQELDA